MAYLILTTKAEKDYELIDSGDGEKLERYGSFTVSRPDPQALWNKSKSAQEWQSAHAQFVRAEEKGTWQVAKGIPERWEIEYGGFKFWIRPTTFKHTGLFPEQSHNWKFIQEKIQAGIKEGIEKPAVLNLFGYTGGATLAAAKAGAEVVHLDGSKAAITWAKENAELSGLGDKPIRWILDDARAFVKREIKRGKKYHGIIMDPPVFGRGPKGEVWKIEEHFMSFLEDCKKLLADTPLFIIINGYASGYSALAYNTILERLMKDFKGGTEMGELAIEEKSSHRLLPAGIFSRWFRIA